MGGGPAGVLGVIDTLLLILTIRAKINQRGARGAMLHRGIPRTKAHGKDTFAPILAKRLLLRSITYSHTQDHPEGPVGLGGAVGDLSEKGVPPHTHGHGPRTTGLLGGERGARGGCLGRGGLDGLGDHGGGRRG
jgi:hypothetical protein